MIVLRALRAVGRAGWHVVRLVREGQDDLDGTYPDHWQANGEDAALHGSVTLNISGLSGGPGRV